MSTLLFALDASSREVIVSESAKGSLKIQFIERLAEAEDPLLYQAVTTLTLIAQAPHMDPALFKAMDKVCQLVYAKRRGSI